MSSNEVYIAFGADTSALSAAMDAVKRDMAAFNNQINDAARVMANAGQVADVQFGKGLQVAGANLQSLDQKNLAAVQGVKGLDAGMRQLASAHDAAAAAAQRQQTMLSQIHASVTAGASSLERLHAVLVRVAALAGITFSVDALKNWVEQTVAAGDALDKEAAKFGKSLEDIQQLHGVAAISGASGPDLVSNLSTLQGELRKSKDDAEETANAFAAIGLSFDKMKGKSPLALLEAIAGAFARYSDGAGKTAVASKLLRTSADDMLRALDRGKAGLHEIENAVIRAGDVMGSSTIDALARMRTDLNELKLAWNSTMLAGVVPAVDGVVRAMARLVEAVDANTIRGAAAQIGEALIRIMGQVAEFAAKAQALLTQLQQGWEQSGLGQFAQSVADKLNAIVDWENHSGTATENVASVTARLQGAWNSVVDVIKTVPGVLEKAGAVTQQYADAWRRTIDEQGKFATTAKDAFGGLDVSAIQLALRMGNIADATNQAAEAFRKLAAAQSSAHSDAAMGGTSYYGPATQRPGSPKGAQVPGMAAATKDDSKDANTAFRDASAIFQGEITAAQEAAEAITVSQNGLLQRHQTDMKSWLAATLHALDAEQDAIQDAADKASATEGLTATDRKRIADNEAQHMKEIAKQIAEAQNKAALEAEKVWQDAANSLENSFNSELRGLLGGTTRFGDAMKKVLGDVVIQGIEWFEKLAVNFVLQQGIMNQAKTAGSALQIAADQAAAAGGLSALLSQAFKAVAVDAAQTFGGVAAFLSPVMGPAALGPAAAAQAAVLSVASMDIGAWRIPDNQLAMVHRNELVMPAAEAGAFRSMLSGAADGAGGGRNPVSIAPTTHFHVNAIDGASVEQWFRSNGREMMRAVDDAVRHGAHLGLRRIATA
jgi:hypothetical protein